MGNTSERDIRLYEALAVYYESASPDRAALLAAYPDLADALAEHFAEQDRLSAMAAPLRPLRTGESPTTPLSGSGESELPTIGDSVHYFGDYELIRELARGGMGVVFEARQVSLNRPVALKMILTGVLASDDDRRRFRLEAEAVANLDHPQIVPIHEVGEHAGFSYFSMKLIPGGSLATGLCTFIDRPRDAARVVATVARAVHHAHQRGILHRDLKPSNVLLDDEGSPHVVDFGLAKRTETGGELTATGAVLGTPAYMAPEQAMGKRGQVTIATDVYGLGAILYTLLAGKAPFGGDSVIDTLEQVKLRIPDPPSGPKRDVARDLQTICLKCLEKDPARRYPSAEALATDLESYLRGEPITARRISQVERAWLWAKRRPAIAALSAATILAVLAGTSAVIAVQARANRNLSGKNTELANTIGLLDQERIRAKQREEQAIDAVKRFRDSVTNEPRLKNSAELEELRKRLLKEPLEFFKSLRAQLEADHDTRVEALEALAKAAFELGELTAEIGDKEDALGAHQQARAIRVRLVRENPNVTKLQSGLAASHNNIGILLSETGKPTEALAAYEQARAIRERLVRENPAVTKFQCDLAAICANIALVLRKTGRPVEALAGYEQAIAIEERLARENPTITEFQSGLAIDRFNVGLLLSETGKPVEALAAYEQAQAIQKRLARRNPTVTQFQSHLANSTMRIGLLLSDTGKPTEGLEACEQARAIHERLARENPTVTEFQSDLANVHILIANLLGETGKHTAALEAHQQGHAIRERLARGNPKVTEFQSDLAISHNTIGNLLGETGKVVEALAAHEQARAIQERLARENPTDTEGQSGLARSHISIGLLLRDTGKPAEALEAFQQARSIRERLARDNPTDTEGQSGLATSHNNIGAVLNDTGKPAEALAAHEQARAIRERLARDNPTVTQFQHELAASHGNIGILLRDSGKPAEALSEYEHARAIYERLARDNPTVTEFHRYLARCHNDIGLLLCETGKPAEGLAAYERARAIRERLAREHPESPDYASDLGSSLNNMAMVDLDAGRFSKARDGLREAIAWQKKALSANPRHPTFRQFLRKHLTNLIGAASALSNDEEVAAAQRELEDLDASDPAKLALDARLNSVLRGGAVKANAERLQLAYHAYERKRRTAAARLFAEALECEPTLANDRERQHAYNAACAAALAATSKTAAARPAAVQLAITTDSNPAASISQTERADKPLSDTERCKVRDQAHAWLVAELARWAKLLKTANERQRAFIAATLKHWLEDPDLVSVRDASALDALPSEERQQWRGLWKDVQRLLDLAASGSRSHGGRAMPDGPGAFAPPRSIGE
jgi:serine/threonine protein kinase